MIKANDLKEIEGLISAYVQFIHEDGFEKAEEQIQIFEKLIEYQKTQLSCVDADVIPKLENLIVILSKKILWLNFAIGMRKLVKDAPRIAAQVYKPFISIVEKGKKVVDGGKDGGKKSGKTRKEKAKPTADAWQAEAEKIWRRHSAWKNARVAADIEKKIGGNVDTIRRSIKKPRP